MTTNGRLEQANRGYGDFKFRGQSLVVGRGHPLPIGTSRMAEGVNFALISRHATAVSLILSEDDDGMAVEIPLDPRLFRTGDHWHIWVDGMPDEFTYAYRVDGPQGSGNRYDRRNVLLDPVGACFLEVGPGASRAVLHAAAWSPVL